MGKDILIYGRIDEWSAKGFFDSIAEAEEKAIDGEFNPVIRINTGGGEPEYGWGFAAKINELPLKRIKGDGKAYSWGFFAFCYTKVEDTECLDVTQFMIHRAAYTEWFESSEYFTEDLQLNLKNINSKLETAVRNRIDVAAFEALPQMKDKGYTLKDIFSMTGRISIYLNAAEAKKIGLVGKIVKLTPEKKTEIETYMEAIETARKGIVSAEINPAAILTEIPNSSDMTIEKLKAEFPTIYNAVFAAGQTAGEAIGKKAEKDRVDSILAFQEIDPAAVKTAIESGEPLTEKARSEFAIKAVSPKILGEIKKDAAGNIITAGSKEKDETEAEQRLTAAKAELKELRKTGK